MKPTGGIPPSRAAIRAGQWERLRSLLGTLRPGNRFYARTLAALGDPAGLSGLAEFSARVPFTTKAEVVADQLAAPPYGTNLSFPPTAYTRCHQTSGTTGIPLRWLDTPQSWDWMVANWVQIYEAAGVRPGAKVFFAFSFGPFIGFWLAFEAAARLGALCLPGGGLSSAARLRMILDHGATVLCCTPTYALHLAEVARAEHFDLAQSPVRTLIVAGEPGGSLPATRARLEHLWPKVRVFDHHGMTEVGPVSHECPACPGVLHLLEAGYYAEVINPATGAPVPAGTTGELVLTTLGRVGSPLLRYRTGDLVKAVQDPADEAAPPCRCGRHALALAGGILGRVDDMIIVRGVNVFPTAVEDVIRRFPEIAEYQVKITHTDGLPEMTVRIEPAAGGEPNGLGQRLQQAFQVAFSLRVPVVAVPPGTLPRFELKARRWLKTGA